MNDTPAATGVRPLASDYSKLVMAAEFPSTPPQTLFDYWTKPDLLTLWWPGEAETDPRVGGAYRLSWPQMGWELQGHYLEFDPPRTLGFTWQWAHQPDLPTRQVFVDFESQGEGTHLRVTHGAYMDTEQDQQDRQEHLEGWTHFLLKLHNLLEGDA